MATTRPLNIAPSGSRTPPPVVGETFLRGPVPDGPREPRIAWADSDARCEATHILAVHQEEVGALIDFIEPRTRTILRLPLTRFYQAGWRRA